MGDTVNVTLTAPIDMDTAAVENGTVQVTNNTTGERTDVTVTERSASSTVFTGSFELPNAESVTVINNVCPEPMQRYNSWTAPTTTTTTTYWGELGGRRLDFNSNEDRVAACRWYIDQVRARFAQGDYKYIDLAGFYWIREIAAQPHDTEYSYHLTRSDILLPEIADYLHRLNYTFSWIPFYDARGHDDWRKFGFDQVYMQPNHYWKPENDLDSACMKINRAGTSIEFEFEASILSADPHSDICRARMRKYMEYAKKHGIYGTRPLAYYQGSNALYDLSVSTDETDREFFHEFCRFVVNNPVRTQHSGKGNK